MSVALFVIGGPGVGKTTTIRELVPELRADSPLRTRTEVEKPKWTICGWTALAGHYHGKTFDGGDTVPYTGAREALEYWQKFLLPTMKLTIFDGDRFSTQPSLDFIRAAGAQVVGVHLMVSDEVAAQRRAERGSNQNETWTRGRYTKAANFAAKIGAHVFDTARPVREVAAEIDRHLDAVFA